ncbi:hypothetical protein [Methanocaldococcus sp.]
MPYHEFGNNIVVIFLLLLIIALQIYQIIRDFKREKELEEISKDVKELRKKWEEIE